MPFDLMITHSLMRDNHIPSRLAGRVPSRALQGIRVDGSWYYPDASYRSSDALALNVLPVLAKRVVSSRD
jgi:hypothetical protein